MYFFQDDIGFLIQLSKLNFWQFLITPQAEHFNPILHFLAYFEFQLFHLNFTGYLIVSVILHFLNLLVLFEIFRLLKFGRYLSSIFTSLFLVNLTFVEPLLWLSAQGVILANLFIGLAFYYWLKKSYLSYFFILSAGLSYSTGLALGIIFGLISLIYAKFTPVFFVVGVFSVLIGPIVVGDSLGQILPRFPSPFINLLQFFAFVIGGVGRGVFGRLFLPGFEPRHFEIGKTLLSFLPFALVSAGVLFLQKSAPKKFRQNLLSLSVLVVYPYIWAAAIRYQFGIKQALAERYAYTPLFFAVILVGLLLKYFFDNKILYFKNILAILVFTLLIFQVIAFYKKAVEFEKRPLETKAYIEDLKTKIQKNLPVHNGPLPSFINQPLKVSDLYPILKRDL